MSLPWASVAIILVFVTPALLLLGAFRLGIPKQRTLVQSDLISLAFFCLISAAINGDIIFFIGTYIVDKYQPSLTDPSAAMLKRLFNSPLPAFRFFETENLYRLIIELHARVIAISALIFVCKKIHDLFEFAVGHAPESVAKFVMSPTTLFRHYIRPVIYHPWGLFTELSFRQELRMVDVHTKEGSLYSGILTNFVPDGNSISAISLKAGIRYYPLPDERKDAVSTSSDGKKPISTRKRALIRNHGELVILSDDIETVHFWGLPKNFKAKVNIYSDADVENLKWFIVLSKFSDHIERVCAKFIGTGFDPNESLETFFNWLDSIVDVETLPNSTLNLDIDVPAFKIRNDSDLHLLKKLLPIGTVDLGEKMTVNFDVGTKEEFKTLVDNLINWLETRPAIERWASECILLSATSEFFEESPTT